MRFAYNEIFAKMRDENRYKLYHILYPRLFNAETTDCDKQRFVRTGPLLWSSYRQALNDLVDSLNYKLKEIANDYIQEHSNIPSWRDSPRLITINPDYFVSDGYVYVLYEGHRFCEEKQALSDAWFFSTFEVPPPGHWTEWVKQTFHPKIAGMFRIKWALSKELQRTYGAAAINISEAGGNLTDIYRFRVGEAVPNQVE